MADKQRYNVSLPEHVAAELEKRAKNISATPTEYAGDIIRWWFGQGCPPVTHDEKELLRRMKPVPTDLDVWHLENQSDYVISDEAAVRKILKQLGIPNLFAQAEEHDQIRFLVAFEDHPTHWLVFNLFKGSGIQGGDGLAFLAYPKKSVSRNQMVEKLREEAKNMGSKDSIKFSQLLEVKLPSSAKPTISK
jgi:hypothetical protein